MAHKMKEESTMDRQISSLWKVSLKTGLLRMRIMPKLPGVIDIGQLQINNASYNLVSKGCSSRLFISL